MEMVKLAKELFILQWDKDVILYAKKTVILSI